MVCGGRHLDAHGDADLCAPDDLVARVVVGCGFEEPQLPSDQATSAHGGRWSRKSLVRRMSGGELMQVELADTQGVEHPHPLRQSGATLHYQPGINNSFGGHTEVAG